MKKSLLILLFIFITILIVMCTPNKGPGDNTTSTNNNQATTTSIWSIPNLPVNLSIKVNKINGLKSDFIKGADISMLAQIEKQGGVYYDTDGKPKDCLLILKNHGVNWVRLRLWNNPILTQNIITGKYNR